MSETREETIRKREARWPEGEYCLLVDHHYDNQLEFDFSKGDTIFLKKEDALRLGMAKCIAPVDSPEAVQARRNPEEQRQQRIKEMESELEKLKAEGEEEAE